MLIMKKTKIAATPMLFSTCTKTLAVFVSTMLIATAGVADGSGSGKANFIDLSLSAKDGGGGGGKVQVGDISITSKNGTAGKTHSGDISLSAASKNKKLKLGAIKGE